MPKWRNLFNRAYCTRVNGYGIAVNLGPTGAWFNVVRHDLDYCFHIEGFNKHWSVKRAKRRALKYVFSLPRIELPIPEDPLWHFDD